MFYRLKDLRRKIKYAIQRVSKGYDDCDVFEFYDSFIKRNIKILKDFKKNLQGHPGNLTDEEWNNVLQEIIDCLKNSDEDKVIQKLFGDDFYDNWSIEKQKQVDEFREHNKNKAFELLNQWFFNLWD